MKDTTRKIMSKTFKTVRNGDELAERYSKLYELVPTDQWVRCKDVLALAEPTAMCVQSVARLFANLCYMGLAERRERYDGFVEVQKEEWIDTNKRPLRIEAYDKDGNYIGMVSNPNCDRRSNGWQKVITTVQRPVKVAEFRLLPLE